MPQKKLQKDSNYNKYDLDGDGIVTDEELAKMKEIEELEMQEDKADAQRKMSWVSLIAMIVFTIVICTPIISEARLKLIGVLHRHGWCCWCLHGHDRLHEQEINYAYKKRRR